MYKRQIIDKRRPKANVSEVLHIIGDVADKKVIVVDDMIDTAGTFCNAVNAVLQRGAKEVYGCATHGVLSGAAVERISASPLKELVLLDTVPVTGEKLLDKIKLIPVAPVFAEAIERIYEDKPISTLFILSLIHILPTMYFMSTPLSLMMASAVLVTTPLT